MKKYQVSDSWNIQQNGGQGELLSLLKEDIVSSSLHDVVIVFSDGAVKTHSVILASISKNLKHIIEKIPMVDTKYIIIPSVASGTWNLFLEILLTNGELQNNPNFNQEVVELSKILELNWNYGDPKSSTCNEFDVVKQEEKDKLEFEDHPTLRQFIDNVCDGDLDIKTEICPKPNVNQNPSPQKYTNECDVCKVVFLDRYKLKNHMFASTCSGKSDYELYAISASLAIIEETVENRRKMYVCKECNYKSKIREHIMNHCQKHTKMYCTKCEQCGKMFRDKGSLKSHIALEHLREKLFKCTSCGNDFATRPGLTKHMKTHSEQEILRCEFDGCDFTSADKQRIRLHVKRKHEENSYEHLCNECGKGFVTKCELTLHADRRHSELLYPCSLCQARYGSEKLLESHLALSHLKIHEPMQCEQCLKLLKNNISLRKHIRIMHTPDEQKPYKCQLCGKGFIKKTTWTMHMNGHNGIKPVGCPQCEQHFRCTTTLKRHLQIHEGTNKYECKHCSKIFTQQYDVKRHVEKDHSTLVLDQINGY